MKEDSGIWPFRLDEVESFAYQKNLFTPQECSKIIQLGKKEGLIKGRVRDNKLKKVRNNSISWIHATKNNYWLFSKISQCVMDLNRQFFKFDLFGFTEGLQFTNYKSPGEHYDFHVDRGLNCHIRKLSFSLQLNDSKTYTGGKLIFKEGSQEPQAPTEQGTLVLFPSFLLHKITPMIKGERNSLVGWITGPNFK